MIGSLGEALAARFMRKRNFAIWKRNWRCPIGELDLIAIKNRRLHLIEVKTRFANKSAHTTLDQITRHKERKLQQLARYLTNSEALALRRRRIRKVQIDFIGIDLYFSGIIPRYTIVWLPAIVSLTDHRIENFYGSYQLPERHSDYFLSPSGFPF